MTAKYTNMTGREARCLDPGAAFVRLFEPDFSKVVIGLFFVTGNAKTLGGILYPVGPTSCLVIYSIDSMEPLYWFGVANDTGETVLISSDPERIREAEEAAQRGHMINGQASLLKLVSTEETLS